MINNRSNEIESLTKYFGRGFLSYSVDQPESSSRKQTQDMYDNEQ